MEACRPASRSWSRRVIAPHVFAIAAGGLMNHWSSTNGPAVASWGPHRLDVFARGADNTLYPNSWTGSAWTGWRQVSPTPIGSDPAAVSWGTNRIDVFALGAGDQMYTMSRSGSV